MASQKSMKWTIQILAERSMVPYVDAKRGVGSKLSKFYFARLTALRPSSLPDDSYLQILIVASRYRAQALLSFKVALLFHQPQSIT
jgi:hypothetical protein